MHPSLHLMRPRKNDRGLVRQERSPNPHYKTGWGWMCYVYRIVIIAFLDKDLKPFSGKELESYNKKLIDYLSNYKKIMDGRKLTFDTTEFSIDKEKNCIDSGQYAIHADYINNKDWVWYTDKALMDFAKEAGINMYLLIFIAALTTGQEIDVWESSIYVNGRYNLAEAFAYYVYDDEDDDYFLQDQYGNKLTWDGICEKLSEDLVDDDYVEKRPFGDDGDLIDRFHKTYQQTMFPTEEL